MGRKRERIGMTVRFAVEDLEAIKELAKHYDVSEADIIRMAVKEFLKNHGFGGEKK
jgi:hypothetical protein